VVDQQKLMLFRRVLDALYGTEKPAISQFYYANNDPQAVIFDARLVNDLAVLPPYWTLSVPQWYDPEQGTLDCDGRFYDAYTTKPLTQEWFPDPTRPDSVTEDVFPTDSPFLVVEIDYLVCHKNDTKDFSAEEVELRKRIQVEAMILACQRTQFPYAALVHSGSKSLHVYIRLTNTPAEIVEFRQKHLDHFVDLCWMVFGNYDRQVLKESGRVRLVRTPGALREDGAEQRIVAAGNPTDINTLFNWMYGQLSQEALEEMRSRAPVTSNAVGARFFHFWHDEWKKDLVRPHTPGERGTHWMHVSKKLAMAGLKRPLLRQIMTDDYDAPWLWWFSAYIFNIYSEGWFFSNSAEDWQQTNERVRWWGVTEIIQFVKEQRQVRKIDSAVAALANTMLDNQLEQASLPPVRVEDTHVFGKKADIDPNRDMTKEITDEKKEKDKSEKESFDPGAWADLFFEKITARHKLIYCGDLAGKQWWHFDGKIWEQTSGGAIRALIHNQLMNQGFLEKHRNEVHAVIAHQCYKDENWEENRNAIVFENGTLYVDVSCNSVEFKELFNQEDKVRTKVPYNYEPFAECPRWRHCMGYFLPDDARRLLFQEMFGYTLMAGQPFQSFFLLLGTGSNFKSTAIKVLEEMHRESREAISLAGLGSDFALGTLFAKKLAIDGDADSINKRDLGDAARILSIVKAWTGGDAVKVAVKNVQGWTTPINPKLVLAANKKPRFIDPTKGVWRRLKIIKFDQTILPGTEIPDYDKILINEEMTGIVVWAIEGLRRLLAQRGFTNSDQLKKDLEEYQLDNDNTLQFVKEFMTVDITAGWQDLRPIYQAYRAYAEESGSHPTTLNEFKNRLDIHGCLVMQPQIGESVNNIPPGSAPHPDHHHWAVQNYRCLHPAARLQAGMGAFGVNVINALPMFERKIP
jgi:putative DNA primase/helicase